MTTAPGDPLARLRAAMDAINDRLVAVLQERAALCRQIARWKQSQGLPLADAGRETAMLAALVAQCGDQSAGEGFAPAALERILRAVLAESRALVLAHGRG